MEGLIKTGRKYDLYVYELNEIEQAYLQRDYYKIEKALKHMYNLLKRSLSENIYHCTKKELKNKLKENDQNLYHFIYAIDTLRYTYCDSFPEEINFYDYDFFELLLEFSNAVEQKYPESLKIKMYDYNRLRDYNFIEENYFLSLVEERNVLSIIKFVQSQYNIFIHLIKYCQVSCDETINLLLKELGSIIQILNSQIIKINNEYDVMVEVEDFFQKQSQLEEIILIKYPDFNDYQKHLQKSKDWSWYQKV